MPRCTAGRGPVRPGDIAAHLQDMYGSQVSKDLVSRVTDAVVTDMTEWANRPLAPVYPVLVIACIFVRIRDGQVTNRPIYVAMGISAEGERDVPGIWVGPTRWGAGRGFWAACDTALGTGEEFQLGYDRIQAQLAADRQNAQSLRPWPGQQATGLRAATLAGALRAYRALGWPVVTDGSTTELETGTVLDALVVPRTAGLLVARHPGCRGRDTGPACAARPPAGSQCHHLRREVVLPRRGRVVSLGRAEHERAGPHAGRARSRLAFQRESRSGSSLRWA